MNPRVDVRCVTGAAAMLCLAAGAALARQSQPSCPAICQAAGGEAQAEFWSLSPDGESMVEGVFIAPGGSPQRVRFPGGAWVRAGQGGQASETIVVEGVPGEWITASPTIRVEGIEIPQEARRRNIRVRTLVPGDQVQRRIRVIGEGGAEIAPGAYQILTPGELGGELDGDWTIRLRGQASDDQPEVRSHTVMVQRDDDNECKLEITDGDIKAWLNGEKVSGGQIRDEDGHIEILNEDGEVVATFEVSAHHADGEHEFIIVGDAGAAEDFVVQGEEVPGVITWLGGQPAQDDTEHPPVMLGIHMDSPDATIAEHYGLDEGEGILVAGVIDGLPADRAGLEDGDIIIAIGDDSPATATMLHDVLMAKEPGDELRLVVVRKGEKHAVEIELAEFDAEKLGMASQEFSIELADPTMMGGTGPGDAEINKMLEHLQHLTKEGKLEERSRRDIEEMIRNLSQMHSLEWRRGAGASEMPGMRLFRQGGTAPRALVTPMTPSTPSARHQEERLARIEDRLERLERNIDRLVEALEKRER